MIFFPIVNAGECEYGTIKAWFSKDQQTWENATVDNATAKIGEPFFIKTTVKAKIDLPSIDIKLWETGENNSEDSTFELLEGLNCFFTYYDIYPVSKNDSFTYIWMFRVKPDTSWVNGNAPLNIYVQFDKNSSYNRGVEFTVANIYVENIFWENYTGTSNNKINNINNITESNVLADSDQELLKVNKNYSYEILLIIIIIISLVIWKQKKY